MSESSWSLPEKWSGFRGYVADPVNAPVNVLCPPSLNVMIDENGEAWHRLGCEDTGVDLGTSKTGRLFHHETYDITFCASGTALKYIDWNDSQSVRDTGLTLTDGTVSRMAEFLGDVYLTNTTDGLRRIVCGRLNDAAADSGDSSVFVDADMAARLSVFGVTSGTLRIQGDSYAFSAVDVSTGEITLDSVTLSKDYDNNAIATVVHDISSSREKASKIVFWKERMHLMGFQSTTNADQPNHTSVTGQFVVGQTGAGGIELIIDFTYGTGGSTKIPVGKAGRLTNMIGMKDYLYFLKESETYAAAAGDVTTTGSGIGGTIPLLRGEEQGCFNEDCAASMGDGEMTSIDAARKRLWRFKIATDTGAPVSFPEEGYDTDVRVLLQGMDEDQSGAMVIPHRARKRTIYQVRIDGLFYWIIYDKNIKVQYSDGLRPGAWQPPHLGVAVGDFFERKGELYGIAQDDDTIYKFNTGMSDADAPIECVIAGGIFDIDDSMVDEAEYKGTITELSTFTIQTIVSGDIEGNPDPKTVTGTEYGYGGGIGVGFGTVGHVNVGGGATVESAKWKKVLDVYPSEGNRVQYVLRSIGETNLWSLSRPLLRGRSFSSSFQSTE